MRQGQTQNPTDQTTNFFWLLILVVLTGLAIWYFARQWFVIPIFWMRSVEIELINAVVIPLQSMVQWFGIKLPTTDSLAQMHNYIAQTPAINVDWENFALINNTVGNIMRYPIAGILAILGVVIYFYHGQLRFRQTYDMKTLRDLEQSNWPQITPVLELDLVNEDIEKGPWAMARTPLRYCQENNIAEVVEIKSRRVWTIKVGPAQRLLTLQIGSLWRGVDALPIHIKALLVVFVARAERDRDVAHELLAQIARSAYGGKLDFSGVEALAQKYKKSKTIRWLERRHAYVHTLMSTLLEIARTDGVLATAEFLWLKPVDRRLWFVLNTVGRQTAVVEVAGAYAHWLAEKKIGRALKTPMIKEAVVALQAALEDTLYMAPGDKWHTINAD